VREEEMWQQTRQVKQQETSIRKKIYKGSSSKVGKKLKLQNIIRKNSNSVDFF
jgi:hypothetical protein